MDRGDVEDARVARGLQQRQQRRRQLHRSADVHIEAGVELVHIDRVERHDRLDAGVVDENVQARFGLRDHFRHSLYFRRLREIGADIMLSPRGIFSRTTPFRP